MLGPSYHLRNERNLLLCGHDQVMTIIMPMMVAASLELNIRRLHSLIVMVIMTMMVGHGRAMMVITTMMALVRGLSILSFIFQDHHGHDRTRHDVFFIVH